MPIGFLVQRVILTNFVPICQSIVEMWYFLFFKLAAVRHLGFSKVGNFDCRLCSKVQYASSCLIWCRSDNGLRRYGRISIFRDGGRPPYWFCYGHIGTIHDDYLVCRITLQNLVGIGTVVSTRWTLA